MVKHISEILPSVLNNAEKANEINRLTSRHIAKLFTHLESKNIFFSEFEQSAIKTQFRQLQDDIINIIGDVHDKKDFNR